MTNTAEWRRGEEGGGGGGNVVGRGCLIPVTSSVADRQCGRLICLWSRVAFVWTSSESHFLFTST